MAEETPRDCYVYEYSANLCARRNLDNLDCETYPVYEDSDSDAAMQTATDERDIFEGSRQTDDRAILKRLVKLNKRLRMDLKDAQHRLKGKDAKISELSNKVKKLESEKISHLLEIGKLRRSESNLQLKTMLRNTDILLKNMELDESKRKLSRMEHDAQKTAEDLQLRNDDLCDRLNGMITLWQESQLKSQQPQKHLQTAQESLAFITLRNLLDKVQEKLAFAAGLTECFSDPSHQGSTRWRKALNSPTAYCTGTDRLLAAHLLLCALVTNHTDLIVIDALSLLNSPGAHLVTANSSDIRRDGDAVAHGPISEDDVNTAIEHLGITGEREEGIRALADFLFTR